METILCVRVPITNTCNHMTSLMHTVNKLNACDGKLFVIIVSCYHGKLAFKCKPTWHYIACAKNCRLFNYTDGVVDQSHDVNSKQQVTK